MTFAYVPFYGRWFRRQVLAWAREGKLRQFFWRTEKLTPFQFLVLEVLLVKTQAATVEPVARELFRRWPDARSLASADRAELQSLLQPLGLFRNRTEALIRVAEAVSLRGMPTNLRGLLELPFAGPYVANAVMVFAYGQRRPIVDANVERVIGRVFGVAGLGQWHVAEWLLPSADLADYSWALLDLGSTVCKPKPECHRCPLATHCKYFNEVVR